MCITGFGFTTAYACWQLLADNSWYLEFWDIVLSNIFICGTCSLSLNLFLYIWYTPDGPKQKLKFSIVPMELQEEEKKGSYGQTFRKNRCIGRTHTQSHTWMHIHRHICTQALMHIDMLHWRKIYISSTVSKKLKKTKIKFQISVTTTGLYSSVTLQNN